MKRILLPSLIALILIVGAFMLTKNGVSSPEGSSAVLPENVRILDGVQIIDVTAKGGYNPRKSSAKAGIPTILRFNTKGTFDCSSSVRIPSLNIGKQLAITGTTEIDLGTPAAGTLQGSCGMGMYPFEIEFQS